MGSMVTPIYRSRDPAKFRTKKSPKKGLNMDGFMSKHPLFKKLRLWSSMMNKQINPPVPHKSKYVDGFHLRSKFSLHSVHAVKMTWIGNFKAKWHNLKWQYLRNYKSNWLQICSASKLGHTVALGGCLMLLTWNSTWLSAAILKNRYDVIPLPCVDWYW